VKRKFITWGQKAGQSQASLLAVSGRAGSKIKAAAQNRECGLAHGQRRSAGDAADRPKVVSKVGMGNQLVWHSEIATHSPLRSP